MLREMQNVLWGHQLFQLRILVEDVLPLIGPVELCEGVSGALPLWSNATLKVQEERLFISHVSDSCAANHSKALSWSKSSLSASLSGPDVLF